MTRHSTITALLGSALCTGLASCPLLAADLSADSGAGGFWALVLGLMLTIFGGMAFCYGLVRLAERVVRRVQVGHSVRLPEPRIRHAA